MHNCLTKQLLLSESSGCLVEKPECAHACQLGFSYICRHPDHEKFYAHVVGALTRNEADELYEALRVKRRDEFVASLDEFGRSYFCCKTDFFGQPLTDIG